MRRLLIGLVVASLAAMCAPVATAQTEDEAAVMQTFGAWITARNTGDSATMAKTWFTPSSYFAAGLPLVEMTMPAERRTESIKSQYESGARVDSLSVHNFDVRVIGDAAVTTCYLNGELTRGEITTRGPWQFSGFWVKQGGAWKLVHFHTSQLAGGPLEVLAGVVEQ